MTCRFYDGKKNPKLKYVRGQSSSHRGTDIRAYDVPSPSTKVDLLLPYRSTTEVVGTMSGASATWGKMTKFKMLEGPYKGLSGLVAHMNDLYLQVNKTYDAGTPIGNEGWTGSVIPAGSGGRHAHIELLNGWTVQSGSEKFVGVDSLAAGTVFTNDYSPSGIITVGTTGIDVSKHQGYVDWKKVKAAGIKFAIIRVAWAGYNGTLYTANNKPGFDEYFESNMRNAIAEGIPVGVYVYSYCDSPASARAAAKNVINAVKPCKVQFPIAFDFEDSAQYASYGKSANTAICKAFLQEVESLGYYSILYTYTNFAASYLNMSELQAHDFWVADYRGYVGYTGAYGMWQYSSTGSVSGVSGNTDMNNAYKDYPTLIYNAGLNNLKDGPAPAPQPIPEPTPTPEGDDNVKRIEVENSDVLELFSSADVNANIPGDAGRSLRADAGHYIMLEETHLKGMPSGYSDLGYKIQYGDKRYYIAGGLGNCKATVRTPEQIIDEFGLGDGCDHEAEIKKLQQKIAKAIDANNVAMQEVQHTSNILNQA